MLYSFQFSWIFDHSYSAPSLKKIRETLYTLLFADFLIHIARGKLMKFLPAIVPTPERTR